MAMTQVLTANGWEVVLVPPESQTVSVDEITGATPLGKLLLKASDETAARAIIDAADSQISVADIIDATTIGRSVLTAGTTAAARSAIGAAGFPVTAANISDASVLGRQLLQASSDSAARGFINAAFKQPIFLQDVYSWSGTQSISDGAFFNIGSLAATLSADSDVGSTRTTTPPPALYKVPAKASKTILLFRIRVSGSVGGSSSQAREWKAQLRRPDGTTIIGSNSTVKVTGTDISNRDHNLISYTFGATDPFSVNGFILGLLNETGQTITMTSLTLTIQRVINLE
ncbi:hypothetical protein [Serratia sp. D1N4]